MCKLFFLILVLNGFLGKIRDPYVPHFEFLDMLNVYPNLIKYSIQSLFLIAGILLFFNYKVRLMCFILGISILITLLSSKGLFRNHILICGCAFLLASFHKESEVPWLLIMQLSVVYYGAAINKLFQEDWWNGVYMHYWMSEILHNKLYLSTIGTNANLIGAKLISWFSMFLELLIATFLLFKKTRKSAIIIVLFFHTLLFSITLQRFGHFLDSILIYLIAFVPYNSNKVSILISSKNEAFIKFLKKLLDWDNRFTLQKAERNNKFGIKNSLNYFDDQVTMRNFLMNSSGFYFVLFTTDLLIRILFENPIQFYFQIILYWGLFIYFVMGQFTSKDKYLKESTYSFQN
ncbi:HTTM domain-containing protein [Maribacter sp. CXY002]|uniref:HTTM domain-containing protein n=1 Tax=Maribacter luteocoastalis TaxID=3407671 RepID=UPI003B673E25